MKLASKSTYLISRFQINMEEIITPYYNLIMELCPQKKTVDDELALVSQMESIFNIKQMGCDHLSKYTSKDSFLTMLSGYLEEQLYQQLDRLNAKVLLLYREDKIVISRHLKKQEVERMLCSWVSLYNPVERLFELVVDECVIRVLEGLRTIHNDSNYGHVVKVSDSKVWQSCIIKKDWLIHTGINEAEVDPCSIWIGSELKSRFVDLNWDNVKLLQNSEDLLGVSVGECVIPFVCVDDFIDEASYSRYFGEMMKNVYAPTPKGKVADKNNDYFLSAGRDPEFSRLLSHLQYNLYISDDVQIPEKYVDMFEPVYGLNRLPGLENCILFAGKPSSEQEQERKTLAGMYEIEKTGSDYNLRNWINAIPGGYSLTKSSNTSNEKCRVVHALKPQYSYYFISKYFEDYFSSILKELDCNHKCGVYLYKEGQNDPFIEIDAFVIKSDGRFIYVENKTCMNKNNIEDTLRKVQSFQELISEEYKNIRIDYYLISPYCDNSLEQNFLYFIKEGNASIRDGVRHKIYKFDIPLASFENISMHCVVEPEYDKMKEIVRELMQ